MEEVPDYFVYKYIMQGFDLNLTRLDLQEFVIKSTGCTPEKYAEILEQISEAWKK